VSALSAGHHRTLLLQAELDGHQALPPILDLLVKRKGYGIDAMRIKMGVIKVIMTYLASPELLDSIGVAFKAPRRDHAVGETLPHPRARRS